MATTPRPTEAPARYMQGVAVPAESVNPAEFFARTRRHTRNEKQFSYTGQPQETVELLKADIISGIDVRFSGQIVVTPGTGTVATTAMWPYNLIKGARVTANGASNLINCSGLQLKVRDVQKRADLTDKGVAQTVAGATKDQGTLALAGEQWGVGSRTSALVGGTYDVELIWHVPIAEDENDLAGAIFLATSSTGITLQLDLAAVSELVSLTGNGAATLSGTFQVITRKFSIPVGSNGQIVVPDLSTFHSLIESRYTAVQNGENEVRLVGQGAGKALLRVNYALWNGAGTAAVPLAMNKTNFGKAAWRYANSETPDEFPDGTAMRLDAERRYNSDIGGVWGFGSFDFAHENAFRDVVDMGTTSELRLVLAVQSGVVLASPVLIYATETVFNAGQGA